MIEKDKGFVLRRYNFRDTSLIVNLYTEKFGKIAGILKGFYTQKKEFSSPLDSFSLNEFVFYPKKSEIWLISYVDLISEYSFLRKSFSKAKIASIMLNIVDKTMQPWDRNCFIFSLLGKSLSLLSNEKENKILCIFLIKFLTFSGFKPELNHCIGCNSVLGREIFFSVSKGGLVCEKCYPSLDDAQGVSNETSRSLAYIQNTDFSLVLRLNFSLRCEKEIFNILGRFLSYHFEFFDLLNLPDTALVS